MLQDRCNMSLEVMKYFMHQAHTELAVELSVDGEMCCGKNGRNQNIFQLKELAMPSLAEGDPERDPGGADVEG